MDTDSDSQPDKVRYGPTTSSHLYLLLCHVYGLVRIRSEVIYNIPALLGFLAMRLSILSLVLPSSLSIQSSVHHVICISVVSCCLIHVLLFPILSVAGGVKGWSGEAQRVRGKADRDREGKEWDFREIRASGRGREWGRRIQDRYRHCYRYRDTDTEQQRMLMGFPEIWHTLAEICLMPVKLSNYACVCDACLRAYTLLFSKHWT